MTARKRAEQTNRALFRIARALYRFPRLDRMLEYITRQVQELIRVAGAMVMLIDEEKQEFYIPVAAYEDDKTGSKMKEIRFPMDKGVAGHVYRTGEPLIVHDTAQSPYFYDRVDKQVQFHTKSMLDVPLRIQQRMIGVLCAVNKTEGAFDTGDVDLLGAVANLVALPIENARINEALQRAYKNVRGLNRAKEQVIHHLSHELKTPLSVLSASLGLLEKRLDDGRIRLWTGSWHGRGETSSGCWTCSTKSATCSGSMTIGPMACFPFSWRPAATCWSPWPKRSRAVPGCRK